MLSFLLPIASKIVADAVNKIPDNVSNSSSWADKGSYHWGKTPVFYEDIFRIL